LPAARGSPIIDANGVPTQARDDRSAEKDDRRFLTAVIRTRPQSDREVFENALLCRSPSQPGNGQVVHKGLARGEIGPESSGKTNLCHRGDGFLSSFSKFILWYQWFDFFMPIFWAFTSNCRIRWEAALRGASFQQSYAQVSWISEAAASPLAESRQFRLARRRRPMNQW